MVLPALALSILLVTTGITWISNPLSRQVEARADTFALRTTNEPDALIALQRRLVIRNVSDPDRPTGSRRCSGRTHRRWIGSGARG